MFEHCHHCKPPKRYPGCQDHCPDGIADKAEYNKRKAADEKARGRSCGTAYEQHIEAVVRANRRKKVTRR